MTTKSKRRYVASASPNPDVPVPIRLSAPVRAALLARCQSLRVSPGQLVDRIVRADLGLPARPDAGNGTPQPVPREIGELVYIQLDVDLWRRFLPTCERLGLHSGALIELAIEKALRA